MRKALQDKIIVITRASDDASELESEIKEAGAIPLLIPMIRIELQSIDGWKKNKRLEQYQGLIFTSAHSAECFLQQIDLKLLKTFKGWVASVGPKTSQALNSFGIQIDIEPRRMNSAEGLAEEILSTKSVKGSRILFPRAEEGRDTLLTLLKEEGAKVDLLPVYRTSSDPIGKKAASLLLDKGKADWLTFASGSAARFFVEEVGAEALLHWIQKNGVRITAIGRPTQDVLEELGLPVMVVPRASGMRNWVREMEAYEEKST